MGPDEAACEAILVAVEAAGRERHDPRQMAESAEKIAADNTAFAAANIRRAALFWAANPLNHSDGHSVRVERKAAITAGIAAGVLSADGRPS